MLHRQVVVTGIGIVSAIATNREDTWQSLLAGRSGIKLDGSANLPLPLARIYELGESSQPQKLTRSQSFLEMAVLEAIADAGLEIPLSNCGLAIGSSRSNQREIEILLDQEMYSFKPETWQQLQAASLSAYIANLLQTQAPISSPMAACATANWAIAQAAMLIQSGQWDLAIAAATDAPITPLTIAGFAKIGVLATSGVHPFSRERQGFALGEGAAALVLESRESAQRRQTAIYGKVLGWSITNDAYHATSPAPDNHLAAIALKDCLTRSSISANQVGYINLHGTATTLNDAREANLISKYLPDFLPNLALSATKGATGHTLGSTGMMEAAFCLLALRDHLLPPTVGMLTPDFDLPLLSSIQRSPHLQYALNFSFGFGGQNAIVAFGAD
ncbi:beta-ketoacyl-ACP reductase [Pseudanabaena sp. FACHB-1277]|uniref:Beta-ketoacyl-ACP reductase n=1 Tax=Pseudanabaena cinerea FACHB-1277 TaxID=2949581 RepID=A0A926Z8Y2_9CYAN|nr:beta-ketoacyl synthase N-terminal-like domain-containing protein [Pseudanabaena cinerea]MBD2151369.1 beta-ketoacyl-ACP reductase [Pseudanabaena cinerea FACHB-1277]